MKLYCVACLAEGLPEWAAHIPDIDALYANEHGEPVCADHALLYELSRERDTVTREPK